jgi:hypothetical protein
VFPAIATVLDQIIANLLRNGTGCEADLNNLMLRFAMDITGIFVFGKDFGTARTFDDGETNELFTIVKDCEQKPLTRPTWLGRSNVR